MKFRKTAATLGGLALLVGVVTSSPGSSAVAAAPVPDDTPGLLINSGLEQIGSNGMPLDWTARGVGAGVGTVQAAASAARSGSEGVLIHALQSSTPVVLQSKAQAAVLANNVYDFSGFVSVESGQPQITLAATFLNQAGTVVGTQAASPESGAINATDPISPAAGSGWAQARLTAVTPATAADVELSISVKGTATVAVDDLDISERTRNELVVNGGGEDGTGGQADGWTSDTTQPVPLTVTNASFEDGTTGPTNWKRMTWHGAPTSAWDSTQAHTGTHSVSITGVAGEEGGWTIVTRPAVNAGASYEFGFWVKGELDAGASALPDVLFYNAAGALVGSDHFVPTPTGTFDWTFASATYDVPAGATSVRLDVRLNGGGSVWYDDISVTQHVLTPGIGAGQTAGRDTSSSVDGAASLVLANKESDAGVGLVSSEAAVDPLERYELAGSIETNQLTGTASLGVEYLDASRKVLGTQVLPAVQTDQAWTPISGAVYPPATAVAANVVVSLSGVGTAHFDGISLMRAETVNEIVNPSAEFGADNLPSGWTADGASVFSWSDQSHTGQRALALTADGAPETIRSAAVGVNGAGAYDVGGWFAGGDFTGAAKLTVDWMSSTGAVLGTAHKNANVSASYASDSFSATAPTGTTSAQLLITAAGKGTLLADDLSLSGPNRPADSSLFTNAAGLDQLRTKVKTGVVGQEYQRELGLSQQWSVAQLQDPTYLVGASRNASFIFTAPANATAMSLSWTGSGAGAANMDSVTLSELTTLQNVPVPDGGFDQPLGSGPWSVASSSGGGSISEDTSWAAAGNTSLRFASPSADGTATAVLADPIPVAANNRYSLGYVMSQHGLMTGLGTQWSITFTDANGNQIGKPLASTPYNWDTHTRWDSQLWNATMASADVYAVTGDKQAAEKTILGLRYLIDESVFGMTATLADGGARPNGEDGYGAVHFGRAMGGFSMAYDLVKSSTAMSAADRAYLEDRLGWMAGTQINTTYYDYTVLANRISNWNSDRAAGLGLLSLAMPELRTSPAFLQHAETEETWFLDNVVLPDGAEPETIRYHAAVMSHMFPFFRALQLAGGPDYLDTPQAESMAQFLIDIQTPIDKVNTLAPGTILEPPIGDASIADQPYRLLGWYASWYATTDPQLSGEMEWTWKRGGSLVDDTQVNPWLYMGLLGSDPSLPSIPAKLTSTAKPNIGYDILRSHVGADNESYMIMSNPPAVYGHSHADATGFSIWDSGSALSLDSGVGGYFNGDNVWFNSADAHNVVQIENANGTWGSTASTVTVSDRFYSDKLDYVKVGGKVPGTTSYERNMISLKGSIDAYLVWDQIAASNPSRFNLHTLSTSVDQVSADEYTAHGNGGVDLDVDLLGGASTVTQSTGAVSGSWPQSQQAWLQIQRPAGQDQLTLLAPRADSDAPLQVQTLDTGIDQVIAFEVTQPSTGEQMVVLLNGGAQDAQIPLGAGWPTTDLRAGTTYQAGASVSVPQGGVVVLGTN